MQVQDIDGYFWSHQLALVTSIGCNSSCGHVTGHGPRQDVERRSVWTHGFHELCPPQKAVYLPGPLLILQNCTGRCRHQGTLSGSIFLLEVICYLSHGDELHSFMLLEVLDKPIFISAVSQLLMNIILHTFRASISHVVYQIPLS